MRIFRKAKAGPRWELGDFLGGLADFKLGDEEFFSRADGGLGHALFEKFPGFCAHFWDRLDEGGEGDFKVFAVFDAIAADEGDLVGDFDLKIAEAAVDAEGDVIGVAEHGIWQAVGGDVFADEAAGDGALVF